MRKIQVPLTRYAHPEYLRDLCNRIEACYFSDDRDWSCIEAIFRADVKRMEKREPKAPAPSASAFREEKFLRGVEGFSRRAKEIAAGTPRRPRP
jgi:hypothetical protein